MEKRYFTKNHSKTVIFPSKNATNYSFMEDFENKEQQIAWHLIENAGANLFLTGKAGTGKTTFLHKLKAKTEKNMVIVAPTGIAAINAGGVTIHSFFQLPTQPFVPGNERLLHKETKLTKEKREIIKQLDLLVIDEVSMVRADLLDMVDWALRNYKDPRKPFGGVQMLLIGDLHQLPPVTTNEDAPILRQAYSTYFFFGSHAFQKTRFLTITLQKVYRQKEAQFLDILNRIRENEIDNEVLDCLNQRLNKHLEKVDNQKFIRLVTHNKQAQQINEERLEKLKGKAYFYDAVKSGNFPEKNFPTAGTLKLKRGAQVMFLRNDPMKRYFNGKIGKIVDINADHIRVKDDTGATFEVEPCEWKNVSYYLDPETKEIRENVEGRFSQYPLRLAWAITIHKSQGLTFDHVVINGGRAFASGQIYVALSRCRTLDGLSLDTPLSSGVFIRNRDVDDFIDQVCNFTPTEDLMGEIERNYYYQELTEQFDFQPLADRYTEVATFLHFNGKDHVALQKIVDDFSPEIAEKVVNVAHVFRKEYAHLFAQAADYQHDTALQDRLKAAANYFLTKMRELSDLEADLWIELVEDNEEMQRYYLQLLRELVAETHLKLKTLQLLLDIGYFDVAQFVKTASRNRLFTPEMKRIRVRVSETESLFLEGQNECQNFKYLRAYVQHQAEEMGVAPEELMTPQLLVAIVKKSPQTKNALLKIEHAKTKFVKKHVAEILMRLGVLPF